MTPLQIKRILKRIQRNDEARSQMWAFLIPGYQEADRNKKKKLKIAFKKEYGPMKNCVVKSDYDFLKPFVIFDDCTAQSSPDTPCKAVPRKGNDNMYVEQKMTVTEQTIEDARRTHFLTQLDKIYCGKDTELQEKFGINFGKAPRTPKELVDWVKAGEFTFIKGYDPEDDETWDRWESPMHGFRWTKIKEDRKGYETARKSLTEELNKFKNEIWAEVDPANFLKVLEKFEKSKLH